MSKDKSILVKISNECWKQYKILSIQHETPLHNVIREALEKHVNIKKVSVKGKTSVSKSVKEEEVKQ